MEYCPPSFDLIDPVLFSIGPDGFDFGSQERVWFALRWYALAYIAGLMLGWRYMVSLSRRPGLWAPAGTKKPKAPFTEPQVDDLLIWATLGVIGGVDDLQPAPLALPFGEGPRHGRHVVGL